MSDATTKPKLEKIKALVEKRKTISSAAKEKRSAMQYPPGRWLYRDRPPERDVLQESETDRLQRIMNTPSAWN
jgi:hypothetical protein